MPSSQERSSPNGTTSATCASASPFSGSPVNLTGVPRSRGVVEMRPQPWAFTETVSQVSEKAAESTVLMRTDISHRIRVERRIMVNSGKGFFVSPSGCGYLSTNLWHGREDGHPQEDCIFNRKTGESH